MTRRRLQRHLGALVALLIGGNAVGATAEESCRFDLTFDSTRDGSTEVYAISLTTGALRQITATPDPAISNRFPDWAPGGRELVYLSEDAAGTGDLYIVDTGGAKPRRLTHEPARYENPAWSPDGAWIAFEKGSGESWGLFLIRPDGSGLRRIHGTNLYHPAWSPDGKRLAVVTGTEDEWFGATVDLDGGVPRRVTPEGLNVGSVKWSPDGRSIAFDAAVDDNFDLYLVELSGASLRRLTTSPAIEARPEWSPDGARLAFNGTLDFGSVHGDDRWDHFELYLLHLDSGRIDRLTENETFDAHPDWCTPSPPPRQ